MPAPRYRGFSIRIVSKDERFQLEVADVDDKQMVIMTDLVPGVDGKFIQEAFGMTPTLSDFEIETIGAELKRRLIERVKR